MNHASEQNAIVPEGLFRFRIMSEASNLPYEVKAARKGYRESWNYRSFKKGYRSLNAWLDIRKTLEGS